MAYQPEILAESMVLVLRLSIIGELNMEEWNYLRLSDCVS